MVDRSDLLIPVKVKWTERPSPNDTKHLHTFLNEYQQAEKGHVICQCPRPMKLSDRVTALPWQQIETLFPD